MAKSFIIALEGRALTCYEELPDSEREYDRQTAIQTLKLIMKLGFDIQKK